MKIVEQKFSVDGGVALRNKQPSVEGCLRSEYLLRTTCLFYMSLTPSTKAFSLRLRLG
jgi:hypothetical protein